MLRMQGSHEYEEAKKRQKSTRLDTTGFWFRSIADLGRFVGGECGFWQSRLGAFDALNNNACER